MSDPGLPEQFPLSPLDDHLVHQTADAMRMVATSDLQAYERHWMVCHDGAGRGVAVVGGSFYPNLDAAEAFAIVNIEGRHGFVRSFRRLGVDRTDLGVGPIRPTIVEGLRHWHYSVEDNEWGVGLELDFHDTTRQVLREPLLSPSRSLPGKQPQVTAGFEGFGTVGGSIAVGDRSLKLDRATARGARDRHWGTGRGVGGPRFQLGRPVPPGNSGNAFFSLADRSIWGDRVFYRFGDDRPGAGRATVVRRRARFEPDTDIFLEAVVDYAFDDGSEKTVRFTRVGDVTAYLRCGLYGGSPEGDRHQGIYPGDLTEGGIDDVSDPAARRRLAGLDQHLCRVSADGEEVLGIFQPVDPVAHAAAVARKRGWSLLDGPNPR